MAKAISRPTPRGEDWVGGLRSHNVHLRVRAAAGLVANGRAAVSPLAEALTDPNPAVRKTAATALGEIGPEAREAIPALVARLRDPDAGVRRQVILALGELGPEARPAVPALVEVLTQDTLGVRRPAAATLGEIGPTAPAAIPALMEALRDPDVRMQTIARVALGKIGPRALPRLLAALKDSDPELRRQVCGVLKKCQRPEAGEALAAAVADPERRVRETARAALGEWMGEFPSR